MTSRKTKQDGFILVSILVVLILFSAEMLILTSGSRTMLFQANRAYLEASEQNLVVSGLAWVEKNINSGNQKTFDKSINLDITDLNTKRATLSVTIDASQNKITDAHIQSSVTHGRQTFRHKEKYRIELK